MDSAKFPPPQCILRSQRICIDLTDHKFGWKKSGTLSCLHGGITLTVYPGKIASPERWPQGKQENRRGILPVRLTSSGTDAGGVQPTPYPVSDPSRGILPVRLTSSGTDAGGVQPTPYPVSDPSRGILPVRLNLEWAQTLVGSSQHLTQSQTPVGGYYPYASPRVAQTLVGSSQHLTQSQTPVGGYYPYASPRVVQTLVVSSQHLYPVLRPPGRGILPVRLTSSGTDAGGVQPTPYPVSDPSRGILPVRLTSSGTDAGGVQPTPYPVSDPSRGILPVRLTSSGTDAGGVQPTPYPVSDPSRGILPVRLTSSGTDAGGVQPTPLLTQSQTTGGQVKVVSWGGGGVEPTQRPTVDLEAYILTIVHQG